MMFNRLPKKLRIPVAIALALSAAYLVRGGLNYVFPYDADKAKTGSYENSPFSFAEKAIGNKVSGDYKLFDQDGKPFEVAKWFDKPLIVNFMWTNCSNICPVITDSLAKIVKSAEDRFGKDYRLLSVGIDFEHDSPSAMKKYGARFTKDFENWKFLSGPQKEVSTFARQLGVKYYRDSKGAWQHYVGVTIISAGRVYAQIFGPDYSPTQIFGSIDKALGRVAEEKPESEQPADK